MIETITLGPRDIEVDHTHIDPIIHIFPNEADPKKVIQDLIEGLFLLHKSKANYDTFGELLKNNNDQATKKMIYIMKRNLANELIESCQYAEKFVAKMKFK